ncbi:helix-turn-helix domain-containing protein [Psychrobacillus sp. NEAU-3TGS]|uniref:helix-turn-helix domain-containing protein n=1 Tax=Psychrobacillus sp. NEAU-3TGS TaxID=2995412 RepID=UPI00249768DA|nr:helix-turn-helix domain-containing protein [Psychrobacillus sp. NEAU-3TGS]MDI2585768.1 helix-turn-helix domain-containing protein [Psychrobacillus sp. NEAU-3TGS]
MVNKAEVLMHPVRMKISQALMRNKENGLTPLEMVEIIQDVPQATLYRHIQVLMDAGVIRILKEKKIRSVTEKYYTLNEDAARLNTEEWRNLNKDKKLSYISYYQLSLMTQYQNYLSNLEQKNSSEDHATFSILELKMDDQQFENFQTELNDLMLKYYEQKNEESNVSTRTIAVTIIPESNSHC